jgi:hypothetical protein
MAATWSFDHLTIYHDLHLHLAIANDLSLAIGLTRVDWKCQTQFLDQNLILIAYVPRSIYSTHTDKSVHSNVKCHN